MPGVHQQSVDQIVEECREVEQLGIPAVILFGLPEMKDERGSEAISPQGVVQRAIEAIRKAKLNLIVITDVCLCEYTESRPLRRGRRTAKCTTIRRWSFLRKRRSRTRARARTSWRLRT